MVKYLSFHKSSFALRYIFNVNGQGQQFLGKEKGNEGKSDK
jgi:hypothetical protein